MGTESINRTPRQRRSSSLAAKEICFLIRNHPFTVLVPLLVLSMCVVVGVLVIRQTEQQRRNTSLASAHDVALQAAQAIQLQLAALIQPVVAIRMVIRQGLSNYTRLSRLFPGMAADLLDAAKGQAAGDLGQQLQLLPQAQITDVYPLNDVTRTGLGLDMLAMKGRRNGTLENMKSTRVTLSVVRFEEGYLAVLATAAVFVGNVTSNQTFGQPVPQSLYCADMCYVAATKTKFWGLVSGSFRFDALLTSGKGPLHSLISEGYNYVLYQRASNRTNLQPTPGYKGATLLVRSPGDVHSPQTVVVDLMQDGFVPWELSVSPGKGWDSSLEAPMYAVVVIVSVIVAVLVAALMISRVQNRELLYALLPQHVVNNLHFQQIVANKDNVNDKMSSSTPAQVMLQVLADSLEGIAPSISTVVQLRATLLSLQDIYRPANVTEALENLQLDDDVTDALKRVLEGGSTRGGDINQVEPNMERSSLSVTETPGLQAVLASLVAGSVTMIGQDPHKQCRARRASSLTTLPEASQGAVLPVSNPTDTNRRRCGRMSLAQYLPNARQSSSSQPAVTTHLGEPIWSSIHRSLEQAWSNWTWDAFAFDEATQGHSLSTLTYFLLQKSGLMDQLNLPRIRVARFLHALEAAYRTNYYHNRVHAADVLQTMHVLMARGGMIPGYADPIRHLAALIAAATHDVDHIGLTNDFLINTEAPLAIRYSDRSPMESHHLATMFSLLKKPENDFVRGLPKESRDLFRKVVIELVLGTDMKQHMTLTAQFTSVHQQAASLEKSPFAKKSLGAETNKARMTSDEVEQMLSLQMALKVADLGSLAESHQVNITWVNVLEEEFFKQGDLERELGMPISPLFDRTKPGVAKCQVGFFSFVGLPLFKSFVQVFPGTAPFLEAAEENFRYWKGMSDVPTSAANASQGNKTANNSAALPKIHGLLSKTSSMGPPSAPLASAALDQQRRPSIDMLSDNLITTTDT